MQWTSGCKPCLTVCTCRHLTMPCLRPNPPLIRPRIYLHNRLSIVTRPLVDYIMCIISPLPPNQPTRTLTYARIFYICPRLFFFSRAVAHVPPTCYRLVPLPVQHVAAVNCPLTYPSFFPFPIHCCTNSNTKPVFVVTLHQPSLFQMGPGLPQLGQIFPPLPTARSTNPYEPTRT